MKWERLFSFFRRKSDFLRDVRLVVLGIGNPGSRYEQTRHNIGFLTVDAFSRSLKNTKIFTACNSSITIGNDEKAGRIALVKPRTFVNRTGETVRCLAAQSTGAPFLVVVDDLNLPLGKIRFRPNGSDGGHNGLKSIIAVIGNEFPRLRIGVGPVPAGMSTVDFVLGPFDRQEQEAVNRVVARAVQAVACYALNGAQAVMNTFN
jgi:PTH1 family peptidyl-tRNA hydrolase